MPGSRAKSTAIVAALPDEVAPLVRRLSGVKRTRVGGVRVTRGNLGSEAVLVAVLGEGAERSVRSFGAMLSAGDVERALLVGVSGSLSPDLRLGDLVLGEAIANGTGQPRPLDASWLGAGATGLPRGFVFSAERIVNTPDEREAIWRRLGSPARAAVDLESAALAHVAADRSIPFAALRVIVDTATDPLPVDFARFQDETGRVRRSRVVLAALREPTLIPELVRLRGRVAQAARTLTDAVEELLSAV